MVSRKMLQNPRPAGHATSVPMIQNHGTPPPLPEHPALTSGLITYLGNKRSLLAFIWEAMMRIAAEQGPLRTMADPFTGSGVVARLGRLAGMEVHARDKEDYTLPFGRAFLEVTPQDVEKLFSRFGGYPTALAVLNSLESPQKPESRYFSRHYAPQDTGDADPARERLFYTQENARRIDAVLEVLHGSNINEAERLGIDGSPEGRLRRDILLASLLVEMSVHNNTSGVMKGYHHGWGGRGGDALGRIMGRVELEPLSFIDGPRGTASVGAAKELSSAPDGAEFDLAYLDPPYTIHQYGANYHLLTSAVRYDFYDPGPVAQGARAGIRSDHYRSDFCRRGGERATQALATVLAQLRARTLLVSYNNDGIIPPQRMVELLGANGAHTVELMSRRYHKFRGGKATQGAVRTREYLFLVYRHRPQSQEDRSAMEAGIEELVAERELHDRFIIPARWRDAGGSAHRGANGSWRLGGTADLSVVLDRELRVVDVELPSDQSEARAARAAITAASSGPIEAAGAAIADHDWAAALRLLKRLKIAKYQKDFQRLSDLFAAEAATPGGPTGLQMEELRRLRVRILGKEFAVSRSEPEGPGRKRR